MGHHAEGRKSPQTGRKMSATSPLKSLRNRRNRKSGLATPIARNKHRNAQRANLLKRFVIARNKHRNKTRLRCAVAAFSSLREAAPATSATIVHDLHGEKGPGGARA
jgi:hypothetical protein